MASRSKDPSKDSNKDHVEREIVIKASRERVFAALINPNAFPTWGPEKIEGKVEPGERPILDFGPSGGGRVAVYVVAVDPPKHFAFRWMQGVTDPKKLLLDPLLGHNTLVEFHLDDVEGGTRVRVVESGLSKLPAIPGMGVDQARENMGKGWQLMLGGLGQSFDGGGALQDRLEATQLVNAPREAVYAALTTPTLWWAEKMDGTMTPGETPLLDFGPFGRWRFCVVAADAPGYLSYQRTQGVDDPVRLAEDPRGQPHTLVEHRLEQTPQGTMVRLTESGFLALKVDNPLASFRRAQQGWSIILGMLEMHFNKP